MTPQRKQDLVDYALTAALVVCVGIAAYATANGLARLLALAVMR